MYVIVVNEETGNIRTYFGSKPELDAKNGGWIQFTRFEGGTIGVPIANVVDVRVIPGAATTDFMDLTAPEHVEVVIREDSQVVWVNVDGIARFRACRIGHLSVEDNRPKKKLDNDSSDPH